MLATRRVLHQPLPASAAPTGAAIDWVVHREQCMLGTGPADHIMPHRAEPAAAT